MEYRTEEIEVGTDKFKTVEYAFQPGDGEVTIFMRYDGTQIDPIRVIGPLIINNHERAFGAGENVGSIPLRRGSSYGFLVPLIIGITG